MRCNFADVIGYRVRHASVGNARELLVVSFLAKERCLWWIKYLNSARLLRLKHNWFQVAREVRLRSTTSTLIVGRKGGVCSLPMPFA